ncbi:Pentatricopeptide repeat-containing protein, chloroplastic, partial [Mucuna pruriens]
MLVSTLKPWRWMQKPQLQSFIRAMTTLTPTPFPLRSASDCVYLKNREIDTSIKRGNLNSALAAFHNTPLRDTVTYNLMISAFCNQPNHALYFYAEMGLLGIRESATTLSSVIAVCTNAAFFREGVQVHCRVVKFGFSCNVFVGGALVGFYTHVGLGRVALELFDELPERNLAVWNVMLRGLCAVEDLLGFYSRMRFEGVEPNGVTFCYLLRGCGNQRRLHEGKGVQGCVLKVGLVESNVFVANALVDFYSACGCLVGARKCFEAIENKDVISWNSLVCVYAENDLLCEALEVFSVMQMWGHRPSVRSLVGLLNLCSRSGELCVGKMIHCDVMKLGFDEGSVHVQSALIDMYGKCRDIEGSVAVFECLPKRTLECFNSLMTSLSRCDAVDDVVELFGLMVDEGVVPDEVTLSTTLKALSVSASGSFMGSQLLHCYALKSGLGGDAAVSCSLMDAYSRWGHVELSRQIFERLPSPNAICFTSMIGAYARNGMGKEGIAVLEAMIERGLKPDEVTFLCALTGCNHTGLVEEGRLVFDSMKSVHGVDPDRRHFSCMVDLLCRTGLLHEAEELLLQAPGERDCFVWSSLLRSCRVQKNEEVGTRAAQVLVELDPDDPAVWLQASNFYAEIGKFDASRQIREVALARKMTREIGHTHGVAGSMICDNIGMLEELKSLEALDIEEEETEVELSDIPSWKSERGGKVLVNIDSFGAAGDGESDDTEALRKAWGVACSTPKSVLLIPQGRRYLVNATKFIGPCSDKLIIQIDGTLVAPDEPKNWDPKLPRVWLDFSKLDKAVFQGSGVIDGSGSKWWAASCKKNKSNALTIDTSSSITVKGLTIQNSQQMHFTISRCDSVRIRGVKVSSPGDSPNTDGIHVSESTNVIIQDSKIGTGDDCISIVNASSNIKMKRIYCGPGHGISIGSLGKDNSTGIVTKVILDTAILRETTNGVRIKTWQ